MSIAFLRCSKENLVSPALKMMSVERCSCWMITNSFQKHLNHKKTSNKSLKSLSRKLLVRRLTNNWPLSEKHSTRKLWSLRRRLSCSYIPQLPKILKRSLKNGVLYLKKPASTTLTHLSMPVWNVVADHRP
jgi:hypothetical protein